MALDRERLCNEAAKAGIMLKRMVLKARDCKNSLWIQEIAELKSQEETREWNARWEMSSKGGPFILTWGPVLTQKIRREQQVGASR